MRQRWVLPVLVARSHIHWFRCFLEQRFRRRHFSGWKEAKEVVFFVDAVRLPRKSADIEMPNPSLRLILRVRCVRVHKN